MHGKNEVIEVWKEEKRTHTNTSSIPKYVGRYLLPFVPKLVDLYLLSYLNRGVDIYIYLKSLTYYASELIYGTR